MSTRSARVLAQSIGSAPLERSSSYVETIVSRVLGTLECGELALETPGGSRIVLQGHRAGPQARLTIHSWRLFARLAFGGDIGFAEAYIAGECSSPNLVALLNLACCNRGMMDNSLIPRNPRLGLRVRHALNRNTRRGSRRNIAAHYDLGNEFYGQWLDAGMTYSAGLFSSASQTLEEAQNAKMDRVLNLLDLNGRESVLEIGCGWGGLAERLLQKHDSALTGITLSAEQLAYAQRRLQDPLHKIAVTCAWRIIATCTAHLIALFRSRCWRPSARPTGRLTLTD